VNILFQKYDDFTLHKLQELHDIGGTASCAKFLKTMQYFIISQWEHKWCTMLVWRTRRCSSGTLIIFFFSSSLLVASGGT
jgi:hypothetical protein